MQRLYQKPFAGKSEHRGKIWQGLVAEEAFDPLEARLGRHRKLVRIAMFAWVLLIACPIRYWRLDRGTEPTWIFALNYAAAQGSAVASKIIFTMGPLAYLTFPYHIGNNLVQGLLLQAGLWLILAAILASRHLLSGRFPAAKPGFVFVLLCPCYTTFLVFCEHRVLAAGYCADADRHVPVTGFMGSGKTTVGPLVAKKLGWRWRLAWDGIC